MNDDLPNEGISKSPDCMSLAERVIIERKCGDDMDK
jgi:hypothetical protein